MSQKNKLTTLKGNLWVVGDAIDTDLIVPSRVLTEQDKNKQISATLELVIPDFASKVHQGDFILAGKNFGCGSSREEAVFVLKELGISAVIAQSFARIFYRNCINLGLPPITVSAESIETLKSWSTGDEISVDFQKGLINNMSNNKNIEVQPFPEFVLKYLESGGAINSILNK
jgi:3-isopropylmalate/(R)-2-methylmalate dehydratase small subunit